MTIFALLNSVSASGAYKFVISAEYNTVMNVECTLFPRPVMTYAGIAPLRSMFYLGPAGGFPARTEYFDNIVAFWHPKKPLQPGGEYTYCYRLTRCQEPPLRQNTAIVTQTLVGASARQAGARLFFVDFGGTEKFNLCDDLDDFCRHKNGNLELTARTGIFVNIALRRNRIAGAHRVSFEFQPARGSSLADLRGVLAADGKPVSEVWLYRWTA